MEKEKTMRLEVVENDFVMFDVDHKDVRLPGGATMTSPGGVMFSVFTTEDGFKIELLGKAEELNESSVRTGFVVKGKKDADQS